MNKRQHELSKWRDENTEFAPSVFGTIKNYDKKRFDMSVGEAYEYNTEVDGCASAYIAFPIGTTTILEENNILWGTKSHSEPESWTNGEEYYKVYQVYVEERYLRRMTEELKRVDGGYLKMNIKEDYQSSMGEPK